MSITFRYLFLAITKIKIQKNIYYYFILLNFLPQIQLCVQCFEKSDIFPFRLFLLGLPKVGVNELWWPA